jgi:hypothetical protein
MPSRNVQLLACLIAPLAVAMAARADDLHIKKTITVGGNSIATSESSIKGARERDVNGNNVTLRQCDLKRTITINDQTQTYFVASDPVDENEARAAALATGAPAETGGKILVTTTVTDTGERKTLYGYPARHLKTTIVQEPSPDACAKATQKFEIDGWYTDLSKDHAACAAAGPPVRQDSGCNDKVVTRHRGSAKLGYPLSQTITLHNADGTTTALGIQASEISKQPQDAGLFDVPAGYRQVNSLAELNGAAPVAQQAMAPQAAPQMQAPAGNANNSQALMQQAMNGANPAARAQAGQAAVWNQAQQMGMNPGQPMNMPQGGQMPPAGKNPMAQMGGNPMAMMQQMMGGGGMPGMPQQQPGPAAAQVAPPKPLGPKVPGMIRIGIAPPDAQVGQGTNTGGDYSTPIRDSMVLLMSGPAVEIAGLDSRIPMQLQAEAQQKQCDFILFSAVAVKHSSGGGFGKFMKMAQPVASMTPIGMMGRGVGGAMAAQAASAAASAAAMSAQQQAMNQLAGFNKQIKSKDDVTVQYSLVQTGQATPRIQNQLQGKAKADGEDVLTPLLQQTANSVLTEAIRK